MYSNKYKGVFMSSSNIHSIINKFVHNIKPEVRKVTEDDKKEEQEVVNSKNEENSSKNKEITMSSRSFADIMESFDNVIVDGTYKTILCISAYSSDEIDADIALIRKKGYEELSEKEAEYKETLMVASAQKKEFTTDMDKISNRMDTFKEFITHVLKAGYPEFNDEQIESFINKAKEKVLTDLQNGKLPVEKYDDGYNVREILHLFQGVAISNASSQRIVGTINKFAKGS